MGFLPVRVERPPKPEGRKGRERGRVEGVVLVVFHSSVWDVSGLKDRMGWQGVIGMEPGDGARQERRRLGKWRTFQIRTSAKSAAFTGDDSHTERRLIVEPLPDGVEFGVPGRVDAIEGLGPREGDEKDVRGWEGDCGEGGWRRRSGETGRGHCQYEVIVKFVR